jgi:competence protein ComEC
VTIGLVSWFALLTRFEPSVLRAAGMALLAATAFWRGWKVAPVRLLALSVCALELIDPLLVWSVGWWLSVSATGALALLARPLAGLLPGPRWVREPLAVTIAAQVGVAPVSLLVFGRVSLLALPANLLAVPVAGFVMAWGIPAGLVAGALRSWPGVRAVVNAPSLLATRWVRIVAQLFARLDPGWSGAWVLVVQAVPVVLVVVWTRHRAHGAAGDPGG